MWSIICYINYYEEHLHFDIYDRLALSTINQQIFPKEIQIWFPYKVFEYHVDVINVHKVFLWR